MIAGRKNILITGFPGTGKTTAVIRIAAALKDLHPCGFYTAEILEAGERQGFELISLDGRRSLFSHVNIGGPFRVSRYGVDIGSFEDFLAALDLAGQEKRLVLIDEIGKMECFSEKFTALVSMLLDGAGPLIATIAQKGGGFITEVKKREDVVLFELTRHNRDDLVITISEYVRRCDGSR
jgi:nucleoside-triphosphatase